MCALQTKILKATLYKRRGELQSLQTRCAETESSYRELAKDMGMGASEVDANIKKAPALPPSGVVKHAKMNVTSKHYFG